MYICTYVNCLICQILENKTITFFEWSHPEMLVRYSFWHATWNYIWLFFWHSIWNSFWHIFWYILSVFGFFWHTFLHMFWHSFWHIFWRFSWHSIWCIFGDSLSSRSGGGDFDPGCCSGRRGHCDLELAVRCGVKHSDLEVSAWAGSWLLSLMRGKASLSVAMVHTPWVSLEPVNGANLAGCLALEPGVNGGAKMPGVIRPNNRIGWCRLGGWCSRGLPWYHPGLVSLEWFRRRAKYHPGLHQAGFQLWPSGTRTLKPVGRRRPSPSRPYSHRQSSWWMDDEAPSAVVDLQKILFVSGIWASVASLDSGLRLVWGLKDLSPSYS